MCVSGSEHSDDARIYGAFKFSQCSLHHASHVICSIRRAQIFSKCPFLSTFLLHLTIFDQMTLWIFRTKPHHKASTVAAKIRQKLPNAVATENTSLQEHGLQEGPSSSSSIMSSQIIRVEANSRLSKKPHHMHQFCNHHYSHSTTPRL